MISHGLEEDGCFSSRTGAHFLLGLAGTLHHGRHIPSQGALAYRVIEHTT
jgi:hypothetical protein